MIEKITSTKTTKEWLDLLDGSGMPYAAINDVKDTLEHEHILARGMVTEIDHETCGPMKVVNHPGQVLGKCGWRSVAAADIGTAY